MLSNLPLKSHPACVLAVRAGTFISDSWYLNLASSLQLSHLSASDESSIGNGESHKHKAPTANFSTLENKSKMKMPLKC